MSTAERDVKITVKGPIVVTEAKGPVVVSQDIFVVEQGESYSVLVVDQGALRVMIGTRQSMIFAAGAWLSVNTELEELS